jgi:hypothetical protein
MAVGEAVITLAWYFSARLHQICRDPDELGLPHKKLWSSHEAAAHTQDTSDQPPIQHRPCKEGFARLAAKYMIDRGGQCDRISAHIPLDSLGFSRGSVGFSIRLAMGFNVRNADWRNSAGTMPLESTNLSTSK